MCPRHDLDQMCSFVTSFNSDKSGTSVSASMSAAPLHLSIHPAVTLTLETQGSWCKVSASILMLVSSFAVVIILHIF